MGKFSVEWDNGKTEVVEQSDCHTLEQFLGCRFGRGVEVPAKVVQLDAVVDSKGLLKQLKKSAKK